MAKQNQNQVNVLTFTREFTEGNRVPLRPSPYSFDNKSMFFNQTDFHTLLQPETALELALLGTDEFQQGLNWGTPRFGHPEGKVGLHVREVLDNVELEAKDATTRQQLRLIALVHDTLKFREFQMGRRVKHHGLLAREFAEAHIGDTTVLDIIELHDEAFYAWRGFHLEGRPEIAQGRLETLLARLGGDLPLYLTFFRCDTRTGDKIQSPLIWFEQVAHQIL